MIVRHAGNVVADHPVCQSRRQRITDKAHLIDVVGGGPIQEEPAPSIQTPALLRPLAAYEAVVGGGW